jgi:tetratricopeptide (TPR) repeat protein
MLALLWLVTGCATQATQSAGAAANANEEDMEAAAQAAVPEDESATVPEVELTSDLLYETLLADIAARRGHLDVSVKLYQKLVKKTGDPRLAERATRLAVYGRMTEEALESAEQWVELDPHNLEARQLVTALYIRSGQPDKALPHVEEILAATRDQADNGFMVVAGLLSREQDKRAALKVMEQVIANRQDDPDALYAYSHLAARLGEDDTALTTIDQVLIMRPDWQSAVIHRARVLKALERNTQALKYLGDQVRDNPEVPEYRLVYARMLADDDKLDEAYEQFVSLVELQPDNEDALFAAGFIALQLEQLDDAERFLSQLRETGQRGYEVNYYLGRLEEMRGNDDAAVDWYASIRNGEHYLNAQTRIIVITARAGDIARAREQIDLLRAKRPAQRLRLYLVEGEILADAEQYEDALQVYNQALEEIPDNADLLYARAMVAEQVDRLDVLEADLKKILARDPNNAEALNALGYTLADRTTRYDEAVEYIKRALELRPNDFFIVDSMGWVQYRLGNHDEAVKYLRRALEIKADTEVAAHLGEVLWVMGKKEEARQVWQRALDSSSDRKSRVVLEVMQRLDQ